MAVDFDRFERLVQRMERSRVAQPHALVGCSPEEVQALESRYGLRLPRTYELFLRVMGYGADRLFTGDHLSVFYPDVLTMTDEWKARRAEMEAEPDDESDPLRPFRLPDDALLIADRLGDQFEFIRCQGQDDSSVWYFNIWDDEIKVAHDSVLAWLESGCAQAENWVFRLVPRGSLQQADQSDPPPFARQWSVYRIDDRGNTFLVRDRLDRDEAERLVVEFTARGHKQMYWTERDRPPEG